ncbi:MAG TPA: HAMP domain-containing sensor histidine kinase, partial [Acidimicrobiales bacterium]|nr:HAMP domain-containing sensor histidine kinase [Acidimicrobiales bacterium]
PGHLEQILDNLLANAVEVSPPGRGIEVGVANGGGAVTVHVRDHGPGLSEQERQRAFDRFWQGGATPTGTSGLGLAIVRQLAVANGGTITLDAPPGGGLDAVVSLPGAAGRHGPPGPASGASH